MIFLNTKYKILNTKYQLGFTVIELMVAMSMFLVLIGVATGTFLSTLRMQGIITELSAANNNATQAVEQISREIRTGHSFQDSTREILKFINYKDETVLYKLGDNSILRSNDGGGTYTAITSPEVIVKRFKTHVVTRSDVVPRVTLVISIAGPKNIDVNLQTTISARTNE